MVGCSAPGCKVRSETSTVTFHRFPSDPLRRARWLKNCNFRILPRISAKLCGNHFDISQFETRRLDKKFKLKPNAVPTIFFPLAELESEDSEEIRTKPFNTIYIPAPDLHSRSHIKLESLSDEEDTFYQAPEVLISTPVVMWKPFQNNDDLYLVKILKNDEFEVYLNDFKHIWVQVIPETAILERFQQLNPLLDIKVEEAVAQVTHLVNNISIDTETEVEKSLDTIHLHLKAKISDVDVTFTFSFSKASPDVFLREMTVPLVQTVKYLEEQQKALCALIRKKDRELEEYKLEKGEISRGDLVTEKFEDEEVKRCADSKTMLDVFGTSKPFWDKFVEQHGEITQNLMEVKNEPWNHIKRKRKVYSARTSKKKGAGIDYDTKEK